MDGGDTENLFEGRLNEVFRGSGTAEKSSSSNAHNRILFRDLIG